MASPYWIIAIISGILLLGYLVLKKKHLFDQKLYASMILACIGAPFAIYIFTGVIKKNNAIKEEMDKGKYLLIEGLVENYIYTPGKGARESFTVNDVDFKYSSSESTYGYNILASEGGSVYRNGQYVRIGYYQKYNPRAPFWNNNYILIMEIKR